MTQNKFIENGVKGDLRRFMILDFTAKELADGIRMTQKVSFVYKRLCRNAKLGYICPLSSFTDTVAREWGKTFRSGDVVTATDVKKAVVAFYQLVEKGELVFDTTNVKKMFVVSQNKMGTPLLRCVPFQADFFEDVKKSVTEKAEKAASKKEAAEVPDTSVVDSEVSTTLHLEAYTTEALQALIQACNDEIESRVKTVAVA